MDSPISAILLHAIPAKATNPMLPPNHPSTARVHEMLSGTVTELASGEDSEKDIGIALEAEVAPVIEASNERDMDSDAVSELPVHDTSQASMEFSHNHPRRRMRKLIERVVAWPQSVFLNLPSTLERASPGVSRGMRELGPTPLPHLLLSG